MALKALLFDVDGTLADTEEVHRHAFNAAFASLGFDWQWDMSLYRELLQVTGGKERLRYYWERSCPDVIERHDVATLASAVHSVKTRYYTTILQSGAVPLRPGIPRLLDEARAEGLLLGIVTTTTFDNVKTLLETTLGTGSLHWFAAIGAGDCVPHKKPAPDIYHWVMERMGVRADECLAFEDSENGLRSARSAGVATLITPNPYTEGQDFSEALAIVPDLSDPDRSLPNTGVGHRAGVDISQLRRWLTAAQAERLSVAGVRR